MPIYKLKLINKREIANGTLQFDFAKPEGFTFKPGQYGGFTLINPTGIDAQNITRRFSILSTPDDKFISIAMRVQNSAYKKYLDNLPLGSEVKFAGPTGTFTLHEDATTPAVLIAGGIGITPFYSMVKHASKQASPQKLFLFYGNQTPADSAFLEELHTLQRNNSNFNLVATMANPDHSWIGETGFITDTMIKKHITDLAAPIYYVCGGPGMVAALQETLAEMGINEERIKVEDFPGY